MKFEDAVSWLRLIRRDRGWTQTDVAARIPCSQGTVSNFETGLMSGRYDFLAAYALALNVELPDELRRFVPVAR